MAASVLCTQSLDFGRYCATARIILSSAASEANNTIAERLKLTKATAGK